MIDSKRFPKIARLHGTMTITEKIDGMNGVVAIGDSGEP